MTKNGPPPGWLEAAAGAGPGLGAQHRPRAPRTGFTTRSLLFPSAAHAWVRGVPPRVGWTEELTEPRGECRRVVGHRWDADSHRARRCLARNQVPFAWYDLEVNAEAHRLLEGRGLYYGADATEAALCAGKDVAVVGGGNSAGQAALHRARAARLPADRARPWAAGPSPTATDRDAIPTCSRPACPGCSPPATFANRSMKRVASAVGEGATAIALIHQYLQRGDQ